MKAFMTRDSVDVRVRFFSDEVCAVAHMRDGEWEVVWHSAASLDQMAIDEGWGSGYYYLYVSDADGSDLQLDYLGAKDAELRDARQRIETLEAAYGPGPWSIGPEGW